VPARLARYDGQADAFSRDGALVARITGEDNNPFTLEIRDVASGRVRWTTTISSPRRQYARFRVDHAFFSPDARWVAVSGFLFLHVWNVASGKEVRPADSALFDNTSLGAFSPDGRQLAIVDNRGGHVLSTTDWTGDVELERTEDFYPQAVAFSADGRRVLRHAENGIQTWDAASGRRSLSIPFVRSQTATSIAISPDGAWLAIGTAQKTAPSAVWLWPLTGSAAPRVLVDDLAASPVSIAFSADGRRLAVATLSDRVGNRANGVIEGNIVVCDLPSCDSRAELLDRNRPLEAGKRLHHTGTSEAAANAAVFTPDGKTLVGAVRGNIAESDEETRFLEFESYPRLSFYGTADRRLQKVLTPAGTGFEALALSRDGKLAATGQDEMTVRLWDVAERRELRSLQTMDPKTASFTHGSAVIRGLVFSPDTAWLATAGEDRRITVWNPSTGAASRVVGEGALEYHALTLGGTGRSLIASRCAYSDHAQIVAFDTASWIERWSVTDEGNGCSDQVVMSADERWVAAAGSLGVRVFDAASGRQLLTIATNRNHAWLAWTPDGRYAGDEDGIDLLAAARDGRNARALRSLPAQNLVPDLLARVLGKP